MVTGNKVVTAYSGSNCSGKSLSFTVNNDEESNCEYCWDSCFAKFDDGSDAHTYVNSIFIPEGVVALAFANCLGSFGYPDPGFRGVLEPGCNVFTNIVHVTFAAEGSTPGTYEVLGKPAHNNGNFESELSTAHWMYGPNGIENAQGTSWYQCRLFIYSFHS